MRLPKQAPRGIEWSQDDSFVKLVGHVGFGHEAREFPVTRKCIRERFTITAQDR